jgi:hypothetical protein
MGSDPAGSSGFQPESQPNFFRYRYHVKKAQHVAANGHLKRTFDLTEGLIARGYSDAGIKMIPGGNASARTEQNLAGGGPRRVTILGGA